MKDQTVEILQIILQNTFTQTQLKHRLRILKSCLSKIIFGGQTSMETASSDLDWLKSLPESFYQKFTKDNLYQLFAGLDREIAQLKPLTIYLAFESDEKAVELIGKYARKTFNANLLLDIKYNPSLTAGAALAHAGVYKDYSLRAVIEEKKEEISQGFKKLLR